MAKENEKYIGKDTAKKAISKIETESKEGNPDEKNKKTRRATK